MYVSPIIEGTMGPTETLGYPKCPTKTEGGEEPCTKFDSIGLETLTMDKAFKVIGQIVLPHKFLPPRQYMHRLENLPFTEIELAFNSLLISSDTTSSSQLNSLGDIIKQRFKLNYT